MYIEEIRRHSATIETALISAALLWGNNVEKGVGGDAAMLEYKKALAALDSLFAWQGEYPGFNRKLIGA